MISRTVQRGYNLVEIAVILTVMLMMSSWLAVNYYNVQENARINETERAIELIKEAVIDYAASHRAASFRVFNGASSLTVAWRVPGGRPYLPCPDITGDGMEDRVSLYVAPDEGVTLAMGGYDEIRPADCYRYKGMLPWRTLNLPDARADSWGNHFTYRVDPAFAGSLLGFDRETAADDSSDIVAMMPPLTVTILADDRKMALRSAVPAPGALVTNQVSGQSVIMTIWGGNLTYHDSPSLICRQAPCNYQAVTMSITVVAGAITTVGVTLRNGGYAYDLPVFAGFAAGNITDGVPVVIMSHGANGYGAVQAERLSSADGIRCNRAPFSDDERQNAYSNEGPCGVIKPSGNPVGQNGFVYKEAPGPARDPSKYDDEYDDVVDWMTANELAEKLTARGVFPVEKLPPLGLEGY